MPTKNVVRVDCTSVEVANRSPATRGNAGTYMTVSIGAIAVTNITVATSPVVTCDSVGAGADVRWGVTASADRPGEVRGKSLPMGVLAGYPCPARKLLPWGGSRECPPSPKPPPARSGRVQSISPAIGVPANVDRHDGRRRRRLGGRRSADR